MSIVLENKKKTEIEILADCGFVLFLFSELVFTHTFINQFCLIFFSLCCMVLIFEKNRIHFNYYFLFGLFFILINIFLIAYGNPINLNTPLKMIRTVIINLIFLYMLYNYILLRNNLQYTIKLFSNTVLLFSFLIVIFSNTNLLNGRLGHNLSIMGGTPLNSNLIAIVVSVVIILNLHQCFKSKNKLQLIKFIWLLIIVLLTGSRKGLLIVLLGAALLVYYIYPNKRLKTIYISTCLTMLTYVAIMNVNFLYQIIGVRVEALLNLIFKDSMQDASLTTRNHFIILGWEYFLKRPWTGYGLDNFRHLHGSYGTYSHNNFIEILISGGIPLFLIYYLPLFILVIQGIKLLRFKNKELLYGKLIVFKSTIISFFMILIVDYAQVSYYDRINLTIIMIALASVRLSKRFMVSIKNA